MANEVIDKIRVCTDKVLPLISAVCDKIGLEEMVDKQAGTTLTDICSSNSPYCLYLHPAF